MSPDMRNGVAIKPVTVSASSGKGLIEEEKTPPEEVGSATFAAAFGTVMQTLSTLSEAVPATAPGGKLPGADAALPLDLPALSAPLPHTVATGPAILPAIATLKATPVIGHGNVSQWPAASRSADGNVSPPTVGSSPAAMRPLKIDPRASEGPVDAAATTDENLQTSTSSATDDVLSDPASSSVTGQSAALVSGTTTAQIAESANSEFTVSGLNGLSPPAERSANSAEAPKLTLDSKLPLMSPQFADRFAEQVTVLVDHGVKLAQISLNPPELGPIEVRITLIQDEANVHFAAHHGAAREAMLEALPKLREMMESAGVRLNDSAVFAELPQRGHWGGDSGMPTTSIAPDPWAEQDEPSPRSASRALHLVDAYV